jgi:release factor glutamine methyltransferase
VPDTIKKVLLDAEQKLKHLDSARLDAELLLAFVTGTSRATLYSHPEQQLDNHQLETFHRLVEKRSDHYPLAYMIGEKEFWSLNFYVNQHSLIPRPETETLVEVALHEIPFDESFDILDLGTGTGAIAVAIAKERPLSKLTAVDIDPATLEVTKKNINKHEMGNICCRQSDLFSGLQNESYDLIVTNPPYVASEDKAFDGGELKYEPRLALDGGKMGLDIIDKIILQARSYLKPSAMLIFEHGFDQAEYISDALKQNGYHDIKTYLDISGHQRITSGRLQ